MLLNADDLAVGRWVAVHAFVNSDAVADFFGIAARITAIELPYLVAEPAIGGPPVTMDVRQVRLMPVSPAFAAAQAGAQPVRPPRQVVTLTEPIE